MNLIDFKINFLLQEEKCQVIFFDEQGYMIDSCDTLIPVKAYKGSKQILPLPIVDNIHEILANTPPRESLIFPRVELTLPNQNPQILDLILSKQVEQGKTYFICVLRDYIVRYQQLQEIVTQQRATAMEKELLEIKHEKTMLENELINLKNEELERLRLMKNDFFAKASHELRTPVNGIVGLAEMLEESASETQKEYIQSLIHVAKQLKTIVNDLLDLSKLEEKKITFEQNNFKLSEIFNNIYLVFKLLAENKGVKLVFELDEKIPKVLLGDSTRISQIIYNLMSNALKFTEKGYIKLKAELVQSISEKRQYLIKFTIKDTGIGIANDKLQQIFEPYTQANDETYRLYGGTGLGLTIVKQLIEAMGGKINVQSKENDGTSFFFTLSFAQGTDNENVTLVNNTIDFTNKKALIADDNQINLIIIAKKMSEFGFVVDTANNGREVLQKLEEKQYDILCLDISMPQLDGYETTKQIRSKNSDYYQKLPIFLMTAFSYEDIKDKVEGIGITDFLTKPFDNHVFLQKLQRHFAELSIGKQELTLNMEQIIEFSQGDKEFEKELMRQVILTINDLKGEYQSILEARKITEKSISDFLHKYNMIFVMLKEDTLKEELRNTLVFIQNNNDKKEAKISLQNRISNLCNEVILQLEHKINQ
jgi:signal transduction histidine kinase/CheY-like chemotaxis protein